MSPSRIRMGYFDSAQNESNGGAARSNASVQRCLQEHTDCVTVDVELSQRRCNAPDMLECYASETTAYYESDGYATNEGKTSVTTVPGAGKNGFRVSPYTCWRVGTFWLCDDIVELNL
ncbi:hypothetical protein AVEN_249606-1 [Araneus ventricosus]|uniref:Uncharacterized protein n=1 Tax=Araneus ventricosus TaxID=182803 RepID=A0A4Y2QKK5_ARAVE|nr:hypothetical protein AVEN_156820-1 [Araneus ventricosus]GBN63867.1 hypothetical protein AVEN_249606-1 [Araneus ventricosus]